MLCKKVSADQITEQYDGAMLFALSSNYINLIDKSVCVCVCVCVQFLEVYTQREGGPFDQAWILDKKYFL